MNRAPTAFRTLLMFALLAVLWCLPLPRAHAGTSVDCTATMTDLSFGSVSFTDGSGSGNSASASATLNYSCTNSALVPLGATACFSIGAGRQSGAAFPRQMTNSGGSTLAFNLYQGASSNTWGTSYNTAVYGQPYTVSFTIVLGPLGIYTGSTTLRGTLVANQTLAPPGSYQDQMTAADTAIFVNSQLLTPPASCAGGNTSNTFTFNVTATIVSGCTVSAGNISIGSVPATATNLGASGTLSVLCSSGTPYYVGLLPSGGSATGAGTMAGALPGNTDKVPYQLRSTAGPTGAIWGNTATSTTVGNGIAGIGTGAAQTLTTYATVPSANFTPDSYADTVQVNVNY